MSYVGTHPTGRKFYVEAKTRRPLAVAVFRRERKYAPYPRWERVGLVEDRPYPNEKHRVDGSYVDYPGEMPPRVKAEEIATWYRECVSTPAEDLVIVELAPAGAMGSRRRA